MTGAEKARLFRVEMAKKKMTINELGEKAGTTGQAAGQFIRRLEKNNSFNEATMGKYAEVLGIPVEKLI